MTSHRSGGGSNGGAFEEQTMQTFLLNLQQQRQALLHQTNHNNNHNSSNNNIPRSSSTHSSSSSGRNGHVNVARRPRFELTSANSKLHIPTSPTDSNTAMAQSVSSKGSGTGTCCGEDSDDTLEWTPVLPRRTMKKSRRVAQFSLQHPTSAPTTSTHSTDLNDNTYASSSGYNVGFSSSNSVNGANKPPRRKKRNISTPRPTAISTSTTSTNPQPLSPGIRKRSRFVLPTSHNSPTHSSPHSLREESFKRSAAHRETKSVESFLVDAFSQMMQLSSTTTDEVEEHDSWALHSVSSSSIVLPKEGLSYSAAVTSSGSKLTSSAFSSTNNHTRLSSPRDSSVDLLSQPVGIDMDDDAAQT